MKETLIQLYNKAITKVLTALGFSSTFVFMACYGPPPTSYYLEVFPEQLDLDNEACDTAVTVATEGSWQIVTDDDFVSVEPASGEGTTTVRVRLQPNDADTLRTTELHVQGTAVELDLTVSQGATQETEEE